MGKYINKKEPWGIAVFSGQDINFSGEKFEGAEIKAIFGSAKCDLRNAIFTTDCAIKATAVFGAVEIKLPSTINVNVRCNSVFGNVSDKSRRRFKDDAVTLYIEGKCIIGSVEIL